MHLHRKPPQHGNDRIMYEVYGITHSANYRYEFVTKYLFYNFISKYNIVEQPEQEREGNAHGQLRGVESALEGWECLLPSGHKEHGKKYDRGENGHPFLLEKVDGEAADIEICEQNAY